MKKKLILFLVVILAAIIVYQVSYKEQLPLVIVTAFKNKYPNETNLGWEIDANDNYEIHFKRNGIKYRADFSPNGEWIETETSITKKELPKPIKKAIKAHYSSEKLVEIEKVDSALKGVFYDVEFKRKGKNMDIEFRENGEELEL